MVDVAAGVGVEVFVMFVYFYYFCTTLHIDSVSLAVAVIFSGLTM